MYNFVKFRTKIIIFRKSGKNRIFGQNFDFQNMDFRPKYRFLSRKFRANFGQLIYQLTLVLFKFKLKTLPEKIK